MNAVKPKLVATEKKARVPKAKRKRGAAKMREAADKILGRDCKSIVEALSSNCKKGQMLSTRFLYDLAQFAEQPGEGEDAGIFRSIATEWANSPEWEGDASEEKSNLDDEAGNNS